MTDAWLGMAACEYLPPKYRSGSAQFARYFLWMRFVALVSQPLTVLAALLLDARRDDLPAPVAGNRDDHMELQGMMGNGESMPARYAARVIPRGQKCAGRLVRKVAPLAYPGPPPGEADRYRRSRQAALVLAALPVAL
jgi:hypothetical protein